MSDGRGPFHAVWRGQLVPIPGPESQDDGYYARGRLPGHMYWSKSFPLVYGSDAGRPGRFAYRVFDRDDEPEHDDVHGPADEYEWVEVVLRDGERIQIKALVGREAGLVKEFKVQRVPRSGGDAASLVTLDSEESMRLAEFFKMLEHLPVEGEEGNRVDDAASAAFFADPVGMKAAYEHQPSEFARMIAEDPHSSDVIAIAKRREVVENFRRMLDEPEFFAGREAEMKGQGRERVWQHFLEENPWILGVGLSGQLLTSWNPAKLEQAVKGPSIAGSGKRVDALMRTVGVISSMVFAEIKHDETDLLHKVKDPYRDECWAPSPDLAGGVTQIQQTVYLARLGIQDLLATVDEEGTETGDVTFMVRPRCYLIAGHLRQLQPDGKLNMPKVRSFELYRRNLYEPEIITFDELLARAEWHLAEAQRAGEGS